MNRVQLSPYGRSIEKENDYDHVIQQSDSQTADQPKAVKK